MISSVYVRIGFVEVIGVFLFSKLEIGLFYRNFFGIGMLVDVGEFMQMCVTKQ